MDEDSKLNGAYEPCMLQGFLGLSLECHLANCKRRKEQRFEVDQVVEKFIIHRNFLDI